MTLNNQLKGMMAVDATAKNEASDKAAQTKAIKNGIEDMVKALQNQQMEKDHVDEVAKSLANNYGGKPVIYKKVAKLLHKGNKAEQDQMQNEVDRLLAEVFKI